MHARTTALFTATMRSALRLWGLAAALLAMPMLGTPIKNHTAFGKRGGAGAAHLDYYQVDVGPRAHMDLVRTCALMCA